jgi:putative polyketide hydroxylase
MAAQEVDVLVVGAGPAGLTAAATLRRYGVDVLVVERKQEVLGMPRATVVSTRSMELFRSWGLEDEIHAGGVEVEWRGLVTETLADAEAGEAMELGLPSREQAAALSPVVPACVPQDHTEAVLLQHVRALGADVRFGQEVLRVEIGDGGVEALTQDGERTHVVKAQYLIGADGARSMVRSALGIPMRGADGMHRSVSALFTAPLWERLGELRYGLYPIMHPDASGVFVPSGRGDQWLYGTEALLPIERYDEAEMARLIRIAAGMPGLEPRIERIGSFEFAAGIADRFAEARAFLIGDAAHRVTPRGGTGMNTAIADGYDLAWKLGWVVAGWADEDLLDTYEEERRPVAAHNVERSLDPKGSYRDVVDEIHIDLGGRIAHLWVEAEGGRVSTLDLVSDGLTLFTGPDGAVDGTVSTDGSPPVTARALPVMTARALGIAPGGSLLVRPSGVPARGRSEVAFAAVVQP